ncbi:MAG: DUF4190 domain-containing protein [Bacteroidales bacterium]|nr:DUF4190 domain-containing protein [Clostridium sp.]MCM1204207.1 DUF4190 domain-containing protein [Bacteroidales bacterium]
MEEKRSRGLEICSLVFGILGIVGCICYGIFGVVGLILSIVALATGKKSGLSIAGLICSIVGILMTIGIYAYTFSQPQYQEMLREAVQSAQ